MKLSTTGSNQQMPLQRNNPESVPIPQPLVLDDRRSRLRAVPVIALNAALIAGTAGAFTVANVARLNQVAVRPVIVVRPANERRVASLQPILQRIKSVFGLTMTELANMFGVSRPAAYAWMSGTVPKEEVLGRIWMLHRAAEKAESLKISRISLLKRRPLPSGSSLLQALSGSSPGIDAALAELAKVAGDTATKQRPNHQRIYIAEDVSITQHGEL